MCDFCHKSIVIFYLPLNYMQKLFAISFSFLMLIQSFNVGAEDISKISVLFEHAQFHQETYGDSFIQFLAEHYGETVDDHENDHEEHQDLPFKHQHQSCSHLNIDFMIQTHTFELGYESFTEIPFNFFYKESTSLFEKPSIFQPPKVS